MANDKLRPDLRPTVDLNKFRFWCQKVLPLVYDDSISYYEVLGKMVTYLNQVIDNVNADTENVQTLKEAFDELDTERAYHQEKRKEGNERLIARKSRIGKVVGFAPMVLLFVAYLIVPMCVIGMTSMTEAFSTMSSMSI